MHARLGCCTAPAGAASDRSHHLGHQPLRRALLDVQHLAARSAGAPDGGGLSSRDCRRACATSTSPAARHCCDRTSWRSPTPFTRPAAGPGSSLPPMAFEPIARCEPSRRSASMSRTSAWRCRSTGMPTTHDRMRGVPKAWERAVGTLRGLRDQGVRDLRIGFTATRREHRPARQRVQLSRELGVEFAATVAQNSDVYYATDANAPIDIAAVEKHFGALIGSRLASALAEGLAARLFRPRRHPLREDRHAPRPMRCRQRILLPLSHRRRLPVPHAAARAWQHPRDAVRAAMAGRSGCAGAGRGGRLPQDAG